MLKHLNEILAGTGIAMAAIGVYVLFSINNVMADHDKDDRAHPTHTQAVMMVDAKVELVALKVELSQKSNEAAHERMMELLKSIHEKL